MPKNDDCCFTSGENWFRYRVGAIIISDGYVLLARGDNDGYYYTVGGGVHLGERSDEAVMREVYEETGERFQIERPLCLMENFFDRSGSLDGFNCHTIELYYLMKPQNKKEYDVVGITASGERERMVWLPLDNLDEYDIRPAIVKKILQDIPNSFAHYINEKDGAE